LPPDATHTDVDWLFEIPKARQQAGPEEITVREIHTNFQATLRLIEPVQFQKAVASFRARLADIRYTAQVWPSPDTYQPLLAFRRNVADLRVYVGLGHASSKANSKQSLEAEIDQMSRDLSSEIQLVIGAVTVQEADLTRQQSERATLLTLLAAIYLPLTLVSGIFGMNIRDITDGKPSFWWCLVVLVVVALLTFLAYLGSKYRQRRQRSRYMRRRKGDSENGMWQRGRGFRGSDGGGDSDSESSMWQRHPDPGNSEGKRWEWVGVVARFFKANRK
jgi:hypothetical protein